MLNKYDRLSEETRQWWWKTIEKDLAAGKSSEDDRKWAEEELRKIKEADKRSQKSK